MKFKTWPILASMLFSMNIKAGEFDVKSFVALDLLTYEKITEKNGAIESGYGTADVKFYFTQEEFSSKIKLDIDGGNAPYDLMEEIQVSYRLSDKIKTTFGKGKIRFHQMHYGITDIAYTDGGYILNTYHSFRDQDRKYMANLELGRRSTGLVQNFTFFGNSQEVKRSYTDDSKPNLSNSSATLSYETSKTFNSRFQRGFSYHISMLPDYDTTYSFAALYFWRDIDPDADYAFDLSYNKNTSSFEVWFEAIFAYTSKHPNDNYTQKKQYDILTQLGYMYKISDKWAVGFNFESAIVQQYHHNKADYPSDSTTGYGQSKYNDGQIAKYDSYKMDIGGQYKFSKKCQFNTGVVWERQYRFASTYDGNKARNLGNLTALGLNLSMSFWF